MLRLNKNKNDIEIMHTCTVTGQHRKKPSMAHLVCKWENGMVQGGREVQGLQALRRFLECHVIFVHLIFCMCICLAS